MTWNRDMSTAPRGKTVWTHRKTKTSAGIIDKPVQEFEPTILWLATKCGKVLKSYFIPATERQDGRWSGFGTNEAPIAWQPYAVPVHPDASAALGEAAEATVAHLFLEDVGGE